MKVPTTQTIIDTHKEIKDLKDSIAVLKSEKEKVKNELLDLTEAKTAILNEFIGGVSIADLKEDVLSNIRRKIQSEVVSLEQQKNDLEILNNYKKNEFSSLFEKLSSLSLNIENKSVELETLNTDLETTRDVYNKEKTSIEKEVNTEAIKLKELKDKNNEILLEIENNKKDFEDKKAFLLKEETRLANKGSDLRIYEARLRKVYLELMPDKEIVV
jgi:chromosome segregation ATPase